MKISTALLVIILLGLSISKSFSQTEDSKYGKDTLKCKQQLSLYSSFVQQKSYKDALPAWRWVFNNCPKASKNIYIHGIRIYRSLIKNVKDEETKQKYVDTLLLIYNQRIKYFKQEGLVSGRMGVNIYIYRKDSFELAYKYLKKSFDLRKNKTEAAVLVYYFNLSVKMMKKGKIQKEDVVNAYSNVSDVLEKQKQKEKEGKNRAKKIKNLDKAIENVEKIFANSGAADCNILTKLFDAKYDENKENAEYLNKVVKLLNKSECTESDLFFKVSEQLNNINPSALSAYSLARMFVKKGQISKASKYYNQAIDLQTDAAKKAQYYYELAALTGSKLGNPSLARTYALKAVELKSNWGAPYILIANLYAASSNNIGDNKFEHQAAFWAAVDKLQKAKSVDPSCANEANKYIGKYKASFPGKEDAFFYNVIEGSKYTVKPWINESTNVRFNHN